MSGNLTSPVRGVKVGTAGDDQGAQSLVADQAEIGAIGDRARLGSALVAVAVAGSAERVVDRLARLRITRRSGRVRRSHHPTQDVGLAPALADAVNDGVNLLRGQHATFLMREG